MIFDHEILNKICLGTGDLLKDKIRDRTSVFRKFFSDGGRLIDTARIYHSGKSLKIIKKLNLQFEIIAKPSYFRKDRHISLRKKLKQYKKLSGFDKIDFFITHWPNQIISKKKVEDFLKLKKDKSLKNIGIGNARLEEIKNFYEFSNKNLNAVEIEFNIFNFFFQKKTLSFCKKNKIIVFGYSPVRWSKYKSFNILSQKLLNKICKNYKIDFIDISLLFCLYKGVIPIVSIKNLKRYNKIKRLNKFINNKVLKKEIFNLEKKIRRTEIVDPQKIWYLVNNVKVKLNEINFKSTEINMIKNEIRVHDSPLKPILLKKIGNFYRVLDGKIRCKALYDLNKKINAIIL